MKRACICNICTCGRHRCTGQATALYREGGDVCTVSEYNEKYPAYQSWQKPESLKPKPEEKGERGRMEATTTFRSDFIPYEVTRRPEKQIIEYQQNPGQIDSATTYKQDFGPYKVQPVLRMRPKERVRSATGKLDTVPTYKEDFPQWELSKRESPKPKSSYHPPAEKFGNATTFQDEFVPRGLVLRESFRPSNVPKLCRVPFDGMTSNQLSYVPHPVEARLVKAPQEYRPSDQPFHDFTTHRHDYQGLPGSMPKSCKPEHIRTSSDAPIQSSTEFRDRFQPWSVSPRHLHKTAEYVTPAEPMDLTTTTHTTFIKHHVQPFSPTKPFSKSARSSAPFQASSTMKEDFKPWRGQRQGPIRNPPEIHRASGKMEDLSTFKAHYIQHQLQPRASCKPITAPLRSSAPLQEETSYRTEFTPKKTSVCPASYESLPGFVFESVDDTGHRFYRPLAAGSEVQGPDAVAVMA